MLRTWYVTGRAMLFTHVAGTYLENFSWMESDYQWWLLLVEWSRPAKGCKEVGKVMEGQQREEVKWGGADRSFFQKGMGRWEAVARRREKNLLP